MSFGTMSSRQFRKVNGQANLPPPPDDSDEDYQPLYARRPANSQYAGLALSSHSESDRSSRSEEELQDRAEALPVQKKNTKKKGGGGKGRGRRTSNDVDDVDRSIQEVNAMLGSPSSLLPSAAGTSESPKVNEALQVLTVDARHLNVTNEVRRLFGPDENELNKRGRMHSSRAFMLRRVLVHPNKDTLIYEFNNVGLSMSKYKEVNKRMYFVFNHNESYQKMHRAFLAKYSRAQSTELLMGLEEARRNMHVEALLEISDRLFRMEENGVANEIVENVVLFLQYVAHPLFILSQNNVRLDYKYMENRPFHVAMLKYVYLLSNKACHRTALEIAKMLLLLDPNDPLALLALIDILALRAREHEWLIDAIRYFDRQREAKLLFNIKYSNALAHFHVAIKNRGDFNESDQLIKEAILAHPQVFVHIMACCGVSNPAILNHAIFKRDLQNPWTPGVEELFLIYAKMTAPRWNEPPVMGWITKNAGELCKSYDEDATVRETANDWAVSRHGLFQVWPPEYLRHISVLSCMSKLILDMPVNSFFRPTCGWDPVFDKSVNRYGYSYKTDPPRNLGVGGSPVYRFFHSMIPSYFDPPVDE
ncbi:hypothetical protein HF086_006955 [Spodoptera exigua]|uniref:Transcription factor 25 n=1 Tax=Spodoptera exigua TaxID=7107 RepID=A0A922MIX3_SPOEX|nr:hypothetical protein HF086_006955 [Spodoptera exigua]